MLIAKQESQQSDTLFLLIRESCRAQAPSDSILCVLVSPHSAAAVELGSSIAAYSGAGQADNILLQDYRKPAYRARSDGAADSWPTSLMLPEKDPMMDFVLLCSVL